MRHIRLDVPLNPEGTRVVTCWLPEDMTGTELERLVQILDTWRTHGETWS